MTNPGTYIARINDYGMGVSKNGFPYVYVYFRLNDGSRLTWYGYLKEGGQEERTLKSLALLGLKDATKLEDLADGSATGLLDLNREVEVVVVQESGLEGKMFTKIKYINPVGGVKKEKPTVDKETVKAALAGRNLGATFKRVCAEVATAPVSKAEDELIPF